MMMNKQNKINRFKLFMVLPLTLMLMALVSMKTIGGKELLDNISGYQLSKLKNHISLAQDSIEVTTKVKKIKHPVHYEYVSALQNGIVTAQIGELQYEISQISDEEEYRKVLEMLSVFKSQTRFRKDYDMPSIISDPEENPKPTEGIQAWVNFLSENLKPTEEAKKMGFNGVMYVEFIVDKEGEIKQPTIRKSMGMGLDDQVLQLFESSQLPKWSPAKVAGKPVTSKFIMPINFGDQQAEHQERFFPEKGTTTNRQAHQINGEDVFDIVEEMPVPSGGREGWNRYVAKNIKYPTEARKKGIQGTVYATFVVNKEGELVNPQILRGIGGGADEEAIRIIQNAENWTPGKQQGVPVNVSVRLPIRFKLHGIDTEKRNETLHLNNQLDEIVVIGYGAQKDRNQRPAINISSIENLENPPLILINGVEKDNDSFKQLDPKGIDKINVLKGEDALEKYEDQGKNGVIEIQLKEGYSVPESNATDKAALSGMDFSQTPKEKRPLFYIDQEKSTYPEVKQLQQDSIKSITVLKEKEAIRVYGPEAKNGVILIVTKKGQ